MRHALTAIADELKRLKRTGVREISISPTSLDRLREAVAQRIANGEGSGTAEISEPEPTPEPAEQRAVESEVPPAPVIGRAQPPKKPALPAPPRVVLPEGDQATRWAALREVVLRDATCVAHAGTGNQVVFGVGSLEADIMFVGDAPGAEEETQGEPFVGPAGQLLTKMIGAFGLARNDVYIANIMNWRPQMGRDASGNQHGNRPPSREEVDYCLPYLRAQVEVVAPKIIVALGATAAHGLLGNDSFGALGEVRGKWHEFSGKPLRVTYHPSYILRNQSNRSKRMIWEDLLQVMERAKIAITEKQRGYFR